MLAQGAQTLRIVFTYDGSGCVKTRYSDAAGTTLVATMTFEYDVTGRVVNILHQDAATEAITEITYVFRRGRPARFVGEFSDRHRRGYVDTQLQLQ